jgi:hypothetical protein
MEDGTCKQLCTKCKNVTRVVVVVGIPIVEGYPESLVRSQTAKLPSECAEGFIFIVEADSCHSLTLKF